MAKNCFIYETLNEAKTLNMEKTSDGLMHLSGVFGCCGVMNNNQRVYEQKNYAKMVESMQKRIEKAPIPGELEHPNSMNITLENVSHRIDKISIDENGVVSGEITLLNTPKGKIAQAIVEGGLPLFISSRATGNVDPRTRVVTLENLQTYDLVGSPGFSQAELHLNESQIAESICESVYYIADKDDDLLENQNNENEDMEKELLNQIQEEVAELKSQIEYLTEQNNILQEQLDEKQDIDLKVLAEGIQKWVCEEFATEVQNWLIEEYSPELQNWIVEEYSQGVQQWVINEAAPSIKESIKEKLVKELNENKENKLTSIDSILEMLEKTDVKKPAYGRKAAMLNEDVDTPRYIAEMPADTRVKYDLASNEVKESIHRRAKIYDWSKEGSIQKFWESVNFEAVPVKNINEGLDKVTDERERAIRAQIRSWRNR